MMAVSALRLLWLAVTPLLLSGCATSHLWRERAFVEPASPPNLELSLDHQRKDVLVQYDAVSDRTYKTRRRAYYLYENRSRIEARRKPEFVSSPAAGKLQTLLMLTLEQLPNADTNSEMYAVTALGSTGFALYSKDHEIGAYNLPVYPDGIHRARQVVLTPFAVVADVTLVSAMVGLVLWADTGFFPLSEQSRGHP
jgi:hypothetical protein